MNYKCYYYYFFYPMKGQYVDNGTERPVIEINYEFQKKSYTLAIFLEESGVPSFARLMISHLEQEALTQEARKICFLVRRHLLTSLRLVFDERVDFGAPEAYHFVEANDGPRFALDAQPSSPQFDPEVVKAMLITGFEYREYLELYSNGTNSIIPISYRFLSLYKLIERCLDFRSSGGRDRFRILLLRYSSFFDTEFPGRNTASVIHDMRDRCAHGLVGGQNRRAGFSFFNRKDSDILTKVIPIMTDICARLLMEKTDEKLLFELNPDFIDSI